MRPTRRALLAAPALQVLPARAQAAWPDRPLRLIVPFPAGSTPDTTGRALAAHLATALERPCVVENRPGAGGNVGTDAIARATDGHTFGVTINGPLTTAQALYPNLPYDPARDLAPISLLVRSAQLLVVHPSLPGDLAGFVAASRARPGAVAFGSPGIGSGSHLAMEDLRARAGIDLVHVPYNGFPQATLDLVAGRTQAMFVVAGGILPQLREGRVRALAVSAGERLAAAPEVPTLAEAGLPGAESYVWNALVGPAATPPDRVARLATLAREGMAAPATRTALQTAGFEVVGSDPATLAVYLTQERARWGEVIQRLGLRLE